VQLDELLDQRQSEPDPGVDAGAGAVTLPKALEHVRQEFGGDPAARVAHHDLDVRARLSEVDLDVAALGGELHRVAEQVPDDLLEPVRIPGDRPGAGVEVRLKIDRLGERGGAHRLERRLDDRRQLDPL
jgi:hypothetical protein